MRVLQIAVIVLSVTSFILFGWSGSYYVTTPTHSDVTQGRTHPLNNHGFIHYLTDREWHLYIWLDVASAVAFFTGLFLNWFCDPFGDLRRRWETQLPQPGEQWPRPKRRSRRLPWKV